MALFRSSLFFHLFQVFITPPQRTIINNNMIPGLLFNLKSDDYFALISYQINDSKNGVSFKIIRMQLLIQSPHFKLPPESNDFIIGAWRNYDRRGNKSGNLLDQRCRPSGRYK